MGLQRRDGAWGGGGTQDSRVFFAFQVIVCHLCCPAGCQTVCVDSGSYSCGSAAAGAFSLSLLGTEGTAAEAPRLGWVCLALQEERSTVRRRHDGEREVKA